MDKFYKRLENIYNESIAKIYSKKIYELLDRFKSDNSEQENITQRDIVLITYGDQIFEPGEKTLDTFYKFSQKYIKDVFEVIHFLPFYPYTSDDGFSIVDYQKINEPLGDWDDINKISKEYKLMFDFVCNHISSKSQWFSEYLKGNKEYDNFFINVDPSTDLSLIIRPRALPLLTKFETSEGEKHIWTTFSEDQIDLNFENPDVLLKMLEVLLDYLSKGASWVRLDAVGYLWKEIGTTCLHHEKTHEVIKLFRDVSDAMENGVKIITETNVPHKDNISYFGNGHDEAHMVYQFPLPPLVIHTFISQNSNDISNWAKSLEPISDDVTYFNFLASHDGVGINPIRGIVNESEIQLMIDELQKECGALISYKNNADGSRSPYEINVSYFSAISYKSKDEAEAVQKFLNAHAILLSLIGVPAIYIHSILGSKNYLDGVLKTGQNRTINREKNNYENLVSQLEDKENIRSKVYNGICDLIQIRKSHSAFSPRSKQEILSLSEKVFAVKRSNTEETVVCINNITDQTIVLTLDFTPSIELISNKEIKNSLELNPYEFVWIQL